MVGRGAKMVMKVTNNLPFAMLGSRFYPHDRGGYGDREVTVSDHGERGRVERGR